MANFQKRLIDHLASELGCDASKIREAINSFGVSEAKPSTPKSKEKHTCERTPRGRTEPCGKRARNEIEMLDGSKHWYCGTEKSGCTKSILGQLKKQRLKKAAQEIEQETIKKTKKDPNKAVTDLLNRQGISKFAKISAKKTRTKSGEIIYMDWKTRILFNQVEGGAEAYGRLAEDNDTILPLGDKEMKHLDKLGISFVEPKETSDKVPEEDSDESSTESDEEILDLDQL